jgi:hypothetical protein
MSQRAALLPVVANERDTRQIVSVGAGDPVYDNPGGATSISLPWPPAGSVAANVLTFIVLALKPGTANLGDVPTPAGWELVGSHIGGGYGATVGANVGNLRVYLFANAGDNTAAGTLAVSVTPDGADGVCCGNMVRIEKLSGSWQPFFVSTGEATADTNVGLFPPSPSMVYSRGDFLIYGFAITQRFLGGTLLTRSSGFKYASPNLAIGAANQLGFECNSVSWGMRAIAGGILPSPQIHTVVDDPTVNNRGPMVVARVRVR